MDVELGPRFISTSIVASLHVNQKEKSMKCVGKCIWLQHCDNFHRTVPPFISFWYATHDCDDACTMYA